MPRPSAAWIKAWIETDSLWKPTVAVGVQASSMHLLTGWTGKTLDCVQSRSFTFTNPITEIPSVLVFFYPLKQHNLLQACTLGCFWCGQEEAEFTYENVFTKLCRKSGEESAQSKHITPCSVYKWLKCKTLSLAQVRQCRTESHPSLNGELKECTTHWNTIKSVRHFFKDFMLWSHSTPLHHPLLWFWSHMFPSQKRRTKIMLFQGYVSSY